MIRLSLLASLASVAALAACSPASDPSDENASGEDRSAAPTSETVGTASLALADGTPAGTVELLAEGDDLSLSATLTGIPEGPHGFHLHTTGECTPPDFTSAGGHLNPADNEHGHENPAGSHLGDLPNLVAGADGNASATVELGNGGASAIDALFDADGTAVVVHADADDYRTDPTGNAGSRIACGVLERA
ncbi:superoxide dismutase family protein [Pelagerythrobacter rhizovicinus]|uniref:Superoxide dismutase family protein n=1 Tax=Pelagerythrobacter rhizovicinus TaxID=2268576 RepID=A0A4Q2KN52_9SPHN|nr:superoxide dismutase family protein [Pelagerythrobacter rhizovicinus]RXZ64873.1 superoxide dismutase family protein [Pelagerythrobacter rhizovicinus]